MLRKMRRIHQFTSQGAGFWCDWIRLRFSTNRGACFWQWFLQVLLILYVTRLSANLSINELGVIDNHTCRVQTLWSSFYSEFLILKYTTAFSCSNLSISNLVPQLAIAAEIELFILSRCYRQRSSSLTSSASWISDARITKLSGFTSDIDWVRFT